MGFKRLLGKNMKSKSNGKYKIIKLKKLFFLICDFNIAKLRNVSIIDCAQKKGELV
jgi:hypothetical protein